MSLKFYGWVISIWLLLAVIAELTSGVQTQSGVDVWSGKLWTEYDLPGVPLSVPIPDASFFRLIWRIISWDFWFLTQGFGVWLRYFMAPITAMTALGFFIAVAPVMAQVMRVAVESIKVVGSLAGSGVASVAGLTRLLR